MIRKIKVSKVAQLTGHNASVFALSAGKDVGHFRSGGGEGWVAEWNLNDPETGRLITKVDTQIFSLCPLHPDNRLVVGNMNGGAHWIDLDYPDFTKNILHHRKGIYGILHIENFVFTIGGDGVLTKWDSLTAKTLESIQLSNQSLRCLAYSAQRQEIAVGASDHALYFLDASSLVLKKRIDNAHQNSVFAIAYHPNNQHLLTGGRDAHLTIWRLDHYQKINTQPAHWFTINDLVFHPKGHLFATASRDKTIKIWDAYTFELLKVLDTIRDGGHVNSVNALYWSAFSDYLISGSDDRSIIIWQIEE